MAVLRRDCNKNFISASKSIAYSAASLIGPSKCIKCVIDGDGQFELTSSVLKLLQVIKVEHPAISIIHDACKGFHKTYGTCSSTLLFMMGSWLQSIELLVDQGIPLPIVSQLLKEAVDICTHEANMLSISITELTKFSYQPESVLETKMRDFEREGRQISGQLLQIKTHEDMSASTINSVVINTPQGRKPSAGSLSNNAPSNRKLFGGVGLKFSSRYSRHYTEADNAQRQQDALRTLSKGIENLSCGMARGNKTIEKLLVGLLELSKETSKDVKHINELNVTLDRIFIEFVDGRSEAESTVLKGLCITTSHADVLGFHHLLQNRPLKVCLVDFEKMKYSKRTALEKGPIDDSLQKLAQFQVSCVIYRGEHGNFREDCLSKSILPLKVNSPKHLYSISKATGNPVVSSLQELKLKDVRTTVSLALIGDFQETLSSSKKSVKVRSLISVQFGAETEERCFTILLCGMTSTITALLEERLWSCLHRLDNILRIGKYVLGSGHVERMCAQKLLRCAAKAHQPPIPKLSMPRCMEQDLHVYRQTVFAEVARGLERYCLGLSRGTDPYFAKGQVIDDVMSKCEAWRRAMRLVDMISRIDVVITKQ